MEWKIKSLSLTAIVIFLKKSWLNQGEPTSNVVLICFYNWFTSVFCAYSKLSNFHSFLLRLIVINTVFFLCARVAEALILGTMMVGQATAFAPNYNKAVLAAARVFRLLDRKPLIDSRGQSGLRLVRKSCNPLFFYWKSEEFATKSVVTKIFFFYFDVCTVQIWMLLCNHQIPYTCHHNPLSIINRGF